MQLFGTHTTEFENNDFMLLNYAALCTTQRDIVFITSNDIDAQEPTGDIVGESVDVEFNNQWFSFECDQGSLTQQGQADFDNFLNSTLFPAIKNGAPL